MAETSSKERLLGELRDPSLHRVPPRRPGRNLVQLEPRVSVIPPLHLPGEVRARVVQDDVHGEMGRGLFIEGPQKGKELLVTMPMVELGDHRAIEDVERREQVEGSGAGKSHAIDLPERSVPSVGQPEWVRALAPVASHPPRRPQPSPGGSDRGRLRRATSPRTEGLC